MIRQKVTRPRKFLWAFGISALILTAGALWVHAQRAPLNKPLSALLPPGALIYMEAQDLNDILTRWNSSDEKRQWVGSDNYSTLSRTRLLGRLIQAQAEFETAANVSPQMQLLTQVAGKESAFAFYDLGNLKFIYITRLDSKRMDANELWQKRPQYKQREVAGISFYERTDGDNKRTVSFASDGDFFVIASDSDLMAGTLALLASQPAPSLEGEAWFTEVKAAVPSGPPALRLVYNMEQLATKPQFRTYWIQQNVTEMKNYRAGISDLYETGNQFLEKRVLLTKTALPPVADEGAVARLLGYVPVNTSFYQAWAEPRREQMNDMVVQTLAGETVSGGRRWLEAPEVSADGGTTGSVSDLETLVDLPPVKRGSTPSLDQTVDALLAMKPLAALQIQSTTGSADGVFVIPRSRLVLAFAKADQRAVESALEPARRALALSGAPQWQRSQNSSLFGELETLSVSANGDNVVFVERGPIPDGAKGNNQRPRPTGPMTYASGYNHSLAFPDYNKLFTVLDAPKLAPTGSGTEPPFFSKNVKSLAGSLPRLEGIEIQGHQSGNTLTEEVVYRLK